MMNSSTRPSSRSGQQPEAPRFLVGETVAKALAVVAVVCALLYGAGFLSAVAVGLGWFSLRSLSCLACSSIWRSVAWSAIMLGVLGVVSGLVA